MNDSIENGLDTPSVPQLVPYENRRVENFESITFLAGSVQYNTNSFMQRFELKTC